MIIPCLFFNLVYYEDVKDLGCFKFKKSINLIHLHSISVYYPCILQIFLNNK